VYGCIVGVLSSSGGPDLRDVPHLRDVKEQGRDGGGSLSITVKQCQGDTGSKTLSGESYIVQFCFYFSLL